MAKYLRRLLAGRPPRAVSSEARELAAISRRLSDLEVVLQDRISHGEHSEDVGPMQYRLDVLERRVELVPVLARLSSLPREAGRHALVRQTWSEGEPRHVICSAAVGTSVAWLQASEPALGAYARRHRWDFLVELDAPLPRPQQVTKFALIRQLLDDHEVVAWLDPDATVVNPATDIREALRETADVYVAEAAAAPEHSRVVDSGFMVWRSSEAARQLLMEIMSDPGDDPDTQLTALLGRPSAPWRAAYVDRRWNSMPAGTRAQRPHVVHYASIEAPHRRQLIVGAAVDALQSAPSIDEPLDDVVVREDLPRLLNRLGLLGVGVEVGVRNGAFSAWLLHRWQGFRLLSVDPWQSYSDDDYVDIANVDQSRHEDLLMQTRHRLRPFGSRSEILRTTSADAAQRLENASLDFVYLDARHDLQAVSDDLARWFPKVVRGGLLSGHDYLDGDLREGQFGVKTAVDEFFGRKGLVVRATAADAPWVSWYVQV